MKEIFKIYSNIIINIFKEPAWYFKYSVDSILLINMDS